MSESETASAVPLDQARAGEAAPDRGIAVLAIADPPASSPVLMVAQDDPAAAPLRVTHAPLSLSAVSALLAAGAFDCLLLNLGSADAQATQALAEVRALAPDLPIVVYTDSDDAALGRTLIAAGAEDWLCAADQDARHLGRALRHAVERHRLRRQQRRWAEAADLVDQRESEERGVGRLLGESGRAGEAARIYGAATLRDSNPGLFDELLEAYLVLIEHAAASQMYRLRPAAQDSARPLAERLGFMGAGPRDVIELHTEALRRLAQRMVPTDEHHVAVEGRIVVLELMGYLASYYRRYYLSRQSLAVEPANAPDRQPG